MGSTTDIRHCCLCGVVFRGYGNNPWPLVPDTDTWSVCCDRCNFEKVIPARLGKMYEREEDGSK